MQVYIINNTAVVYCFSPFTIALVISEPPQMTHGAGRGTKSESMTPFLLRRVWESGFQEPLSQQ